MLTFQIHLKQQVSDITNNAGQSFFSAGIHWVMLEAFRFFSKCKTLICLRKHQAVQNTSVHMYAHLVGILHIAAELSCVTSSVNTTTGHHHHLVTVLTETAASCQSSSLAQGSLLGECSQNVRLCEYCPPAEACELESSL